VIILALAAHVYLLEIPTYAMDSCGARALRGTLFGGTSMILGCPECNTRFAIDAQALRPDGRRVKCGKCDHVWFEEPPTPNSEEPISVTPLEPEEQSTVSIPNLPALATAEQKRTASAAWVLVGFLVAVVLALAWFGRESIALAWPPAETIYASVGISAFPPPGEGLAVEMNLKQEGKVLRVFGELVNTTDEIRAIPPVYAVIEDGEGKRLQHWQFNVDAVELGPGESVPFSTKTDSMPAGAKNVRVLFTNPADNP
jgi:predicted Zn finger-like uncharacterized protein